MLRDNVSVVCLDLLGDIRSSTAGREMHAVTCKVLATTKSGTGTWFVAGLGSRVRRLLQCWGRMLLACSALLGPAGRCTNILLGGCGRCGVSSAKGCLFDNVMMTGRFRRV
jgi:hypothetical protein